MRWVIVLSIILALGVAFLAFPRRGSERILSIISEQSAMSELILASPAFVQNGKIPAAFTCDGKDIHPRLEIHGVPADSKSLVLIMDDPDAPVGVWDHWVAFNIPPETRVIEEGKEPEGVAGKNSWGRTGYGGPCPPSGTHRYFFKLYALDTLLLLREGAGKREVERAIAGHILAQAELIGLYARSGR